MAEKNRWKLEKAEKDRLIAELTPKLRALRTRARISQGELANLIGISRQNYGAVERGARGMSWNTCIALLWFYDCHAATHQPIRSLLAFPEHLIKSFQEREEP